MSITMDDMIDQFATPQAHSSVETRPHAQAHTMLEETAGLKGRRPGNSWFDITPLRNHYGVTV